MRRLSLRRFPDVIVRRRQGPGGFNFYGEPEPGAVVTAALPASVQPISLADQNFVGGEMLRERIRVFVPVGVERVAGTGDTLRWFGAVLSWNGSPLSWGGFSGVVVGAPEPLQAAFDDCGADQVQLGSIVYAVEESQLWSGSHCRATLLRET